MSTTLSSSEATHDALPPALDALALERRLRDTFDSERTRPASWRKKQLRRLLDLVRENSEALLDALREDLGRPAFEGWLAEIHYLEVEIEEILKAVDGWMKPRKTSTPLVLQPGRAYVQPDPLGVVLIISPWNYPIQLCLAPLAAALAAGNCAVVKPSELSAASSRILADLLPRYLDSDAVAVVEGAVAETTALLEQRWDHILFTGGERVGKVVMAAAARHLTPVTLELGGKSPVIVDHTADIDVAARRILWGKAFNSGQTCIAPDYILVEEAVREPLTLALIETLGEFFGDDPQKSPDYGRMVSLAHYDRVVGLTEHGRVRHGGHWDREDRFIEITLLEDVEPASPLMQEEIFGPLLPILPIRDIEEAIRFVNARPKPLALYVHSRDRAHQEAVLHRTSSGGLVMNDSGTHFVVSGLPFGGVGTSGMGAYHGRHGFDTFSHLKAVFEKPTFLDPALRYPPYTESKKRWAERLM